MPASRAVIPVMVLAQRIGTAPPEQLVRLLVFKIIALYNPHLCVKIT
nr:MAG TPA: hypothetical protein [Caudoviricetes sp.]DAL23022.1 MAG TPA_asm: hypothetical protein [Caudoviricetes sp.]